MDQKKELRANTKLKEERLGRGWSQQHVADQLGTAVVTVNRWERGSQQPSAYFRLKLCALFGKSAEELGLISESSPSVGSTGTETSRSVEPFPHRRRSVGLFVLVTVLIMIVIGVGEYAYVSGNAASLQMKATATVQTSKAATSVILTQTASSSDMYVLPTTSYLPSLARQGQSSACTTSLSSNPLSQRDPLGTRTIIDVYVNCMHSSYTVAMDWRDGTASSVWCPLGSCNAVTFAHIYRSPFSNKLTKAFIWNVTAVYQYVTVY